MRILEFTNFFFPSVGGTQLATYYLAKDLVKTKVDLRLATFNVNPHKPMKNGLFSSGLPSYEEIGGVPVHRFSVFYLGDTNLIGAFFKVIFSPSAILYMLREKPDIVHFQGVTEIFQAVLIFYASIFTKSKTLLTTHGLDSQVEHFRKRGFSRLINETLLKLALRRVTHIIALSKGDFKPLRYLGIPVDKVSVIPNGVDISKFSGSLRKDKKVDAPSPSLPYFLCVTRIREDKGIEFLMEVAVKVVVRLPEIKFVVVGDCPEDYAQKLEKLAEKLKVKKNFEFTGYISNESNRLAELYRGASAFVLPSSSESLPLVLLEAMASGLPIVACRVGGIPDLVDPSEGFLLSPGDVSNFSHSLLYLLENDAARIEMGKSARKKAETYSWESIAKRTMSLYKKLLRKDEILP